MLLFCNDKARLRHFLNCKAPAMKKRKLNRLKGCDYSQNNLYFVTNCVKNNRCCLGRVVAIGTGRDLSVREFNIPNFDNSNPHLDINYGVELNQYGLIIEEKINWLSYQYPYVIIHNYVVMPNHFHIILEIDSNKVNDQDIKIKSLSSLIGALKTITSSKIHKLGFEDFAWHRSFHDHIIRNEITYLNVYNYINLNPKKWFEDRFFSKY